MSNLLLEKIEALADKFRAENGFSSTEPINAKTVLRRLNILAMYRPLSENSWGLSLKTPDKKHLFMLINSNSTRGRQHFTIAHELFHLIYEENPVPHFCNSSQGKDMSEKKADMFASSLLLPRQGVLLYCPDKEIFSKNISLVTVLRIEQLYGVSHQAAAYRFKRLGLISEERLQQLLKLNIIEVAHEYGIDPSLYEKGNENLIIGDFGAKARKLFEDEKISEGHYIELINLISDGKN